MNDTNQNKVRLFCIFAFAKIGPGFIKKLIIIYLIQLLKGKSNNKIQRNLLNHN